MNKLTNDQITDIWEAMPGQPGGWLKQFGYIQFARAIEDAVSTAVGEPVATDDDILDQLHKRVSEAREAAYTFGEYSKEAVEIALGGVLDMIDEAARLAAPTQVSAPQANELSISRQKLNMAKIDVLMDGARARSEEFRDGVTFGANSLHMKMLELAGAPQASAAQEVRAVPDDEFEDWGSFIRSAGYIETRPGHFERPTSTSTAPAAMDEKGGAK